MIVQDQSYDSSLLEFFALNIIELSHCMVANLILRLGQQFPIIDFYFSVDLVRNVAIERPQLPSQFIYL